MRGYLAVIRNSIAIFDCKMQPMHSVRVLSEG
jgi:hypothetical protein